MTAVTSAVSPCPKSDAAWMLLVMLAGVRGEGFTFDFAVNVAAGRNAPALCQGTEQKHHRVSGRGWPRAGAVVQVGSPKLG